MNSATLKSIVLFLLNDVDVKTNENAIELFERWRKTTHYCVKDPLEVKWCLEYLNAMKSFNRDALKRTAIADGFISAWWIKGKRNKKQLMEGKDMSAKRKKDIEEKYTTDAELIVLLICIISTSPSASFCSGVILCLENHNIFFILNPPII